MTTRVYKYMHIYLWSAAWRPDRVVLNMEASVQAAGEDGGHVAGGGEASRHGEAGCKQAWEKCVVFSSTIATIVYKYMHIYLWSAAWRVYRVVLNMEASVQAAGGIPRGDLALLNAVVVEVVVVVAAGIAHPEDLVDIVAVNIPALRYPACIGFSQDLPAVIVIITDSLAAVNKIFSQT